MPKYTAFFPTKSNVFICFARPYNFSPRTPNSYIALSIHLVTTSAVNREMTILIISVYANPFTVPEPSIISTTAAIKVVIFPSRIADSAFWNPACTALRTDLPAAISSRIRAKITTFASTAIPIPRIIPAIPGSVSVISNSCSVAITIVV